jgi:hypothetical protein
VRNRSVRRAIVQKSEEGCPPLEQPKGKNAMLTRILAVALAAGSLAFATAHAQTGSGATGSGSSTTTSPSTTTPSTGSTGTTMPSTGSTGSMGSSGMSGQQAQQPMGSSSFDPTKYKSKTECLNAAATAHASTSLCNNLK